MPPFAAYYTAWKEAMDNIGQLFFYASVAIPPTVFFAALYRYRRLSLIRGFGIATLASGALFVAFAMSAYSIVLRDGLAPGMLVSAGSTAFRRSIGGIAFSFGAAALLLVPVYFLLPKKNEERAEPSGGINSP